MRNEFTALVERDGPWYIAERATLLRLLIDTLDSESAEGAEDAWRAEVEHRIGDLDSGAVEPIPWEELRARLYQR